MPMNTELAESIQTLIDQLNLRKPMKVKLLTGESAPLPDELAALIEAGTSFRVVVIMNEAGYNYSVANKERYPSGKVWLVVATGVFPHAAAFVRCGGDSEYIEEFPLSRQTRDSLCRKLRLVGSGIVG